MSTIKVDTIEAAGAGPVAIPSLDTRMASAWANFNGAGTVAIRDSYNVASITDNGVGDYSVNFTAALVNSNYCIVSSASAYAAVNSAIISLKFGVLPTTLGFSIRAGNLANGAPSSATFQDPDVIGCAIFGGRA